MKRKVAAVVSYAGSAFSGWQKQANAHSVQAEIEIALTRLTGEKIRVIGAGRTDAGAHAKGQVCSFYVPDFWETTKLSRALNANIAPDVRIMRIIPVDDSFDARRSALWREYVYFIWMGNVCVPHLRQMVWQNPRPWDFHTVEQCCRLFEGKHDFSAFCKASELPQNSIREIFRMTFRRKGSLAFFRIKGNAYLTNMVRIMIGSINLVAIGKKEPDWIKALLTGKPRTDGGPTAPAKGLFLWKIGYDTFTS